MITFVILVPTDGETTALTLAVTCEATDQIATFSLGPHII